VPAVAYHPIRVGKVLRHVSDGNQGRKAHPRKPTQ
jgi:hypothetical protein